MEVREALQKRRSIRKYTEDAVSKEQLEELLHAAMSGPSACNRTPWDFYVVTDPEVLKKLREAAKFSKITAPAAIVEICQRHSRCSTLPTGFRTAVLQQKIFCLQRQNWDLVRCGAAFIHRSMLRRE